MRYLLVVLVAFARAARAVPPPTPVEIGALVAAETLLFMDMGQTLQVRRLNERNFSSCWRGCYVYEEVGLARLAIGPNPSDVAVVSYFAGSMLLTAAVWYFVPETRILLSVVIAGVQVPTVVGNAQRGLGLGFGLRL